MESGLEDRNNRRRDLVLAESVEVVSMESGLEDRNNQAVMLVGDPGTAVSMESGLEDRNNILARGMGEAPRPSQWSPA